jgi:glycosyltransferase involved in cell wall biosynthesis
MEKDDGMYDAVNRGLRRATGDVMAYLNCDEQYLPGVLSAVAKYFEENPAVDIAFGHTLVVDPNGEFMAFRKAIIPGKIHTWVSRNLAVITSSTFFRRRVLDTHGLFFDTKFKDLGDGNWVMRAIDKRLGMGILPFFVSSFAETGENRNIAPTALREKDAMVASAPAWARALRPAVIGHYRLRKLWHGGYRQEPFDYAIYTAHSPHDRVTFHVAKPSYRWRS